MSNYLIISFNNQYTPQNAQPMYTPGHSQPYAPGAPPPPEAGEYGADVKSPYEGERFKPKKRVKDPMFLVLFIAQLVGYCIISGIVLSAWIDQGGLGGALVGSSNGTDAGSSVTLNKHTIYLSWLVTAVALLLAVTQLMITRIFTRAIMHVTPILSICLNIGVCVYFWIKQYYLVAFIFTGIALFSILSYSRFRSRIPLASLLLQVVMDISKHHLSVYAAAFASLIIQAALTVWFAFATIATYAKWAPSCSTGTFCFSAKVGGLLAYEIFSYVWTSQVIGNVALATLAGGPYGAWYYFGPREAGQMPNHPTLSSFLRASTSSLGSIAFGSLIVTLLETLRIVLDAECCIDCFESMVEYFNRYAYIEIALYGKPYIRAARDTWNLFKDRGIDVLVDDSFVGMMLTWGAYVVGTCAALSASLYLRFTYPSYNTDAVYTALVLVFAFLIGLQCSLTLSSVIEAGVSTILVGLSENPEVLAYRAPELFELIRQKYPSVVRGVNAY